MLLMWFRLGVSEELSFDTDAGLQPVGGRRGSLKCALAGARCERVADAGRCRSRIARMNEPFAELEVPLHQSVSERRWGREVRLSLRVAETAGAGVCGWGVGVLK